MKLRIDFKKEQLYNVLDVLDDYGVTACERWSDGIVVEANDEDAEEIEWSLRQEAICEVFQLTYPLAVQLEEINIRAEMAKIDAKIDAVLRDIEQAQEWTLNGGS